MKLNLSPLETRIIGALIEKEATTPEQYPLSLNALTNACNQKSNREPVLNLEETTVQDCVDELVKKRLVTQKSGFSSRVPKYQHRFANTEFSELQFDAKELAIICVLFLRGPQTPGELRSRTNRLCEFNDVHEVEESLRALITHTNGPYVVKLPREAGKRENRYAHLFSGDAVTYAKSDTVLDLGDDLAKEKSPLQTQISEQRLLTIEERLDVLSREIVEIKQQLNALSKD